MKKQRVAFFDIDGTVFRSSLLVELVEKLIDERVFPEETRMQYEVAYRSWLEREGSYDAYIDGVVRAFIKQIRGVHYGVLADIGRVVVAERSKHVYRYTRDLITDLKSRGYYIVAISQSPKFILDEFCASYGFDKVYGRLYELGPQDRFTGVVTDLEVIADKANIVKRVFERNDFDRTESVGVGDTESDVPLLASVEVPICFNPNMKLYTHAQKMGWKVVVERKDVVYTL